MRIRAPFAAAFSVIALLSGYLSLGRFDPSRYSPYQQSDKVLHFVALFVLTLSFYWVFETTRRRAIHLTLTVVTLGLGCASEFIQGALPNGREFDPFDIPTNVVGSLVGLGLCSWYHRRMLERKRVARGYRSVSGDEELGGAEDVELSRGDGGQETGVTVGQREVNIDHELENWDENAPDDWDEEENPKTNGNDATPKMPVPDDSAKSKRDD